MTMNIVTKRYSQTSDKCGGRLSDVRELSGHVHVGCQMRYYCVSVLDIETVADRPYSAVLINEVGITLKTITGAASTTTQNNATCDEVTVNNATFWRDIQCCIYCRESAKNNVDNALK